jgi:hypothetical protein
MAFADTLTLGMASALPSLCAAVCQKAVLHIVYDGHGQASAAMLEWPPIEPFSMLDSCDGRSGHRCYSSRAHTLPPTLTDFP